jgi:hypothetical protein
LQEGRKAVKIHASSGVFLGSRLSVPPFGL